MLAQIVVGAQAIPVVTRVDPVPGGASLTELRFVQTAVHASAGTGPLRFHGMASLEGLTMPDGHLTPGAWGEGYIDRRHPHTYVHELVVSAIDPLRLPGIAWSITAGKGFAPFGTDDPMNRPPLSFPVNHHFSQILERLVLIGAVRAGPITLEGALFNGDEPERPSQWPDFARFGDSWSLRLFGNVWGFELQLSRANVTSPEHRQGAGLDHYMWNGSVRVDRATRFGRLVALAEIAKTDEEGAFQFGSQLAEGQLAGGSHRAYLRFERTERPEETRTFGDPFRGVRPHNENSNLGTTRWTTVTGGYARTLGISVGPATFEAIAEAAHAHVTRVTGVVFDPEFFYGRNDMWLVSVGVRIVAGAPVHRMGRYGIVTGHTSGPEH